MPRHERVQFLADADLAYPVWLYDPTNWQNPSTTLSHQHDTLN